MELFVSSEFDMSVGRREALVAAGLQTAQAYFVSQEAALLNPQLAFSGEAASAAIRTADRIASRLLEP